MKKKHIIVKVMTVALIFAVLTAASFFALRFWESRHASFETTAETEKETVEYEGQSLVPNTQIQTMLVIGLDRYKDATVSESHESGSVQADFLMLFVIDNAAEEITAIHINRDTIVNVNRLDITGNKIGSDQKQIALAYDFAYDSRGGINCRNTADSVSDLLLGIKVNHYFSLTMDSVPELNDLVGGVGVTVLDDFTGIDDTLVEGELTILHGEQALRYVRTRYGLEDSSNSNRMRRQQQYIRALMSQLNTKITSDTEFALEVIDKMKPYIQYDSTEYRLKEFAQKFQSYRFAGVREIDGTLQKGEEYMEFYPDYDSLLGLVFDLFYQPSTT